MKKNIKFYLLPMLMVVFGVLTSCLDDLDQEPNDSRQTSSLSFQQDPYGTYQGLIAKLYGSYILTGNDGPAGAADITAPDEGFTSYLRVLWQCQELTTDEAIVAWNDAGVQDLNFNSYSAGNGVFFMMYYRPYFSIALANEFLRESTDELIESRGLSGSEAQEVRFYRSEARALRAFSYYHLLDTFGNVGLVTEDAAIGGFLPEQMSRADLFNWIESELLDMEDSMREPGAVYARVDKGMLWMLLSKLYMNAEVYTGQARYSDALTYINKVINEGGYQLASMDTDFFSAYETNFLADNHTSPEMIFAITADGTNSRSFGGTTYIINAACGGNLSGETLGVVNGGWGGNRTRNTFYDTFDGNDGRGLFFVDEIQELNDVTNFAHGIKVTKFKNITSQNELGSAAPDIFVDTDFPVYRLADAYLMYAECVARGAGGDANTALGYVNQLRERAFGDDSGNVNISDVQDLDFILEERGRELYWEGHRRQDLIRFGKYHTSEYLWEWKGGSPTGSSFSDHLNIFPIPPQELTANPNLTQNPGY